MCVICGDTPTWRYHFADGRRFTSSMAHEYAEAQARAVAETSGAPVVRTERFVSGKWITHGPKQASLEGEA